MTRTEAILEAIRTAVWCNLLESTSAYEELAAALLIEGAISEWTKAKGADSDDVAVLFQRLREETAGMDAGKPRVVREEFRTDLGDFTPRQGDAAWYEGLLDTRVEDSILGDTRVRPGRVFPLRSDPISVTADLGEYDRLVRAQTIAQAEDWQAIAAKATRERERDHEDAEKWRRYLAENIEHSVILDAWHPDVTEAEKAEKIAWASGRLGRNIEPAPTIAPDDAPPAPSAGSDADQVDGTAPPSTATAGDAAAPAAPAVESASDLPAGAPADREAADGSRGPVVMDSGGMQPQAPKARRRREEAPPPPLDGLAYRCGSCSYKTQQPGLLEGHVEAAHRRAATMAEMIRR